MCHVLPTHLAPPNCFKALTLYYLLFMLLSYICRVPNVMQCIIDRYHLHASKHLILRNLEESFLGVITPIFDTLFFCATICCTLCIVTGNYQFFVYVLYFIMSMYLNYLNCIHVNYSHSCLKGHCDSRLSLIYLCNSLNAKTCLNVYVSEHATTTVICCQ